MNFAPDTFESVHRRKKLAAWLATLKGPAKKRPDWANLQNTYCGFVGVGAQAYASYLLAGMVPK